MNAQDPKYTAPSIQPLNGLQPISRQLPASILQGYLILVVTLNFGLLFLKGYSQDLGYWQDWVRQLSTGGYDGFNGNYPPVYIHWLYLVGKFYNLTAIPLEHNDLLKFLTQLPVVIFHCLLTLVIFRQLQSVRAKPAIQQSVMALTVFNPAILVNGPIWGQVDLVPAVMVYFSLVAACSWRYAYLAIPLFVLALLTKFQSIAFAPVFGFLFFTKLRQHIAGIFIAILLGAFIFLPSIIAGHFWQSVRQAYIDTLGQYPMTTFNAANIWILLTGNTVPDSVVLFGAPEDSIWARIFMAKNFGMLLFSSVSLLIFVHGIYFLIKHKIYIASNQLLSYSLFSASICALAFFTLLPAMHERYLFPAAIMALGFCASARQKIFYPALISLACALNMLIILEINGSDIWLGLAWLTLGLLVLALLDQLSNQRLLLIIVRGLKQAYRIPLFALWFFLLASSLMLFYLFDRYQLHQIQLTERQVLLTELPLNYARQDHGTIAINRSFDGNRLSVANRRYAQGIGTHSRSDIQYQLPENAKTFSFKAALDDEVGTADVKFSVWGDGKLLWESPPIYGYERNIPTHHIDVTGVRLLNLKVDPLKDDKWDHANWINTVIELTSE